MNPAAHLRWELLRRKAHRRRLDNKQMLFSHPETQQLTDRVTESELNGA